MAEWVNQGPDRRLGGVLGRVLAAVQRALSVRTRWKPGHVLVTCPPYLSITVPHLWRWPGEPRYATLRLGWRYDEFWGDRSPCGTCESCRTGAPWRCLRPVEQPPPHGGYIFDVAIKLSHPTPLH